MCALPVNIVVCRPETLLGTDVDGKAKKAWEQPSPASSNANNGHALLQAAGIMAHKERCAACCWMRRG